MFLPVVSAALGSAPSASTNLTVGALLSDHAVLQTSADSGAGPGVVRGTAAPGVTVRIVGPGFPGAPYATKAGADGTWSVALESDADLLRKGRDLGPFNLTVTDDSRSGAVVTASDVYYGNVFFCSGQSNMVYTVDAIDRAKQELADANHPNIRLFQLARDASPEPGSAGARVVPFARSAAARGKPFGLFGATAGPAPVLRDVAGSCLYGDHPSNPCDAPIRSWARATPAVVGRFSAVCYLAARDLMLNRTGADGAIGLIESDYGGTPVQAWSPPAALRACGMPTDDCRAYTGGRCKDYPARLFNRMVAPFAGWGLRSFIWYQGEANSDEGFPLYRDEYRCVFGQMIEGWRDAWAAALGAGAGAGAGVGVAPIPFVFVQLSAWTGNWGFEGLPCVASYCPVIARIKLAQADVAGVGGDGSASPAVAPTAAVGMAIADDWGGTQASGVHPPFKTQPAQRVARQLLRVAFGDAAVQADGPRVVGARGLAQRARGAGGAGGDGGGGSSRNGTAAQRIVFTLAPRADGAAHVLRFEGTNDCDQQYSKLCCGSDGAGGPVLGRVCTHANATLCAADAGDGVYEASFALESGGAGTRGGGGDAAGAAGAAAVVLTATADVPSGETVRWVDYAMTDFPQCKVVDQDGLPMSTFGPLAVPAR
eukprot:g2285.t1